MKCCEWMMRVVTRSHPKSTAKQASKPPKTTCSLSNRPPRTPLPTLNHTHCIVPVHPRFLGHGRVGGRHYRGAYCGFESVHSFLVHLQSMALLETISFGFLKPNILRTVLYDETASYCTVCVCTIRLCFLRIYHDSEVVDRWTVCQLSSSQLEGGCYNWKIHMT